MERISQEGPAINVADLRALLARRRITKRSVARLFGASEVYVGALLLGTKPVSDRQMERLRAAVQQAVAEER